MEDRQFIISTDERGKLYRELLREFKDTRFFDGPAKASAEGELYSLWGEKYFYRNGSRIFATIIIFPRESTNTMVKIILGGGSHELTITYGAEKSFMKKLRVKLENVCEAFQWSLREVEKEREEGQDKKNRNHKEDGNPKNTPSSPI